MFSWVVGVGFEFSRCEVNDSHRPFPLAVPGCLFKPRMPSGILMTAVSPLLIGELLAAVAIYLFILDQLKVLIFRHFKVH